MQIKCDRESCGHEWNYLGKSKHKATCPMCRKIVDLTKQKREKV